MTDVRPRGFPRRFPVRPDTGLTLRYRACRLACRLFCTAYIGRGRLVVEGAEHVPRRGPLVVASNHLSVLDPMLIGAFLPGAACAMAKVELFRSPLVAWVYGGCNVFPVERGSADRRALGTAIDLLDRGGRLVLFVEGTRATRPGMGRAEPGVGFLLRRRPCPVLPVAITGTEASLVRGRRLPRRVPMTLRFGPAVTLDLATGARHANQAVADQVGELIAALLPEAYRGRYRAAAGGDDSP